MTWLKRFLQLTLTLSLTMLLSISAFLQIIGSGITLNQIVRDTGFYTMSAQQIGSSLKASSRVPVEYQLQFNAAIDKALTAEQVEEIIKPALVDVADWMNTPAGTAVPNIILIIKPAKDALIAEMQNSGLSAAETEVLRQSLSTQIPDQIQLSSLASLTGTATPAPTIGGEEGMGMGTALPAPGAAASPAPTNTADPQTNQIYDRLNQLKQAAVLAGMTRLAAIVIAILCLGGLLWFGRADGRKWLRRPGWSAISSSVLFVSLAIGAPYIMPALLSILPGDPSATEIISMLVVVFFQAALLPAALIFMIGLALILGAFFIRPKTSSMQPISQLPYRQS